MSQVNLREPADLRELASDELDIVSGGFPCAVSMAYLRQAQTTQDMASFLLAWTTMAHDGQGI